MSICYNYDIIIYLKRITNYVLATLLVCSFRPKIGRIFCFIFPNYSVAFCQIFELTFFLHQHLFKSLQIKLKSSILSKFIIKISMQTFFYFYLHKVIIKLIEIFSSLIFHYWLSFFSQFYNNIYFKFIPNFSLQLLFYYFCLRPKFMAKANIKFDQISLLFFSLFIFRCLLKRNILLEQQLTLILSWFNLSSFLINRVVMILLI